jgi:hypothetical protein
MSADLDGTGRRRSRGAALLLPLIAFVLGVAAMGWALSQWSWAAHAVGLGPAPAPAAVQAPAPAAQLPVAAAPAGTAVSPQSFVIDPETTRRVAQLEQRLGEIYNQSRAAVGNADRAEGLLVAFAARRALDRGVGLGYIEGLLQQRFGDTHRAAVATVITASRSPVTLEDLQGGLKEIGPALTGAGPDQNWWDALRAEMAGIIIVRKEGTPPTMPAERLGRATQRLESGKVDVALAEVMRMPGRGNATDWIQKARRYIAARRALDSIETAALLDPRNPPQPAPPPAKVVG